MRISDWSSDVCSSDLLETAGPGLQEGLNQRTHEFVARLNAILDEEQSGITVQDFSSLFRFVGASDLFYNHMIQNGVYVWEERTCFLSTAHSDHDLRHVARAVRDSVRGMRARGILGSNSFSTAAVAPQHPHPPAPMPPTTDHTA